MASTKAFTTQLVGAVPADLALAQVRGPPERRTRSRRAGDLKRLPGAVNAAGAGKRAPGNGPKRWPTSTRCSWAVTLFPIALEGARSSWGNLFTSTPKPTRLASSNMAAGAGGPRHADYRLRPMTRCSTNWRPICRKCARATANCLCCPTPLSKLASMCSPACRHARPEPAAVHHPAAIVGLSHGHSPRGRMWTNPRNLAKSVTVE